MVPQLHLLLRLSAHLFFAKDPELRTLNAQNLLSAVAIARFAPVQGAPDEP
jgi:hypothetical protein